MPDRPRVVTRVTAEINPLRTGCELALTHEHVPPERAHETEGSAKRYARREDAEARADVDACRFPARPIDQQS